VKRVTIANNRETKPLEGRPTLRLCSHRLTGRIGLKTVKRCNKFKNVALVILESLQQAQLLSAAHRADAPAYIKLREYLL
jgi:hypothetical protein